MNKHLLFLTLLLFLFPSVYSQTEQTAENKVAANLAAQIMSFPQEKIYLQTDRPYYVSGEKIYFRTFLLHASLNRPLYMSRFVYVELINPAGELVLRQQILIEDDKMFYGALKLFEDLPEGYYRIRAYTRYMENMGKESFYNCSIFITTPNSSRIEIEPDFKFVNDKQVAVSLQFKNRETQNKAYPERIRVKVGDSEKFIETKTDGNGLFYETINIKDPDKKRILFIDYQNGPLSFSKYLSIPYKKTQPEITFYPEGGNLIAENLNRVAFKVLLPDGNSAEIKGSVYNSEGKLQTTFSTLHEGMGDFYLKPELEESYYAQFEYQSQIIKTNLPKVKTNTYALNVNWRNNNLLVSLRKGEEMAISKLYLLIHTQGVPRFFEEWDFSQETKSIDKSLFKDGINHLMLLDSDLNPLSERLIFQNNTDNYPVMELQTNKEIYKPREQIKVGIQLSNIKSDTIPATFAIAITDDKDVKLDTTTHIRAEILLVSELKGKINNPAWYFTESNEAKTASDLLMLTHGWRNYHVPEALQVNLQQIEIKPETSQSLSGVLKNERGRAADFGIIQMKALGYDFEQAVEADKNGRYFFDGFEFPDSTAIYLFANNKKREIKVDIIPDSLIYPEITPSLYSIFENKIEEELIEEPNFNFSSYVAKSDRKYTMENGIRVIQLDEVIIKRRRRDQLKSLLDNQTYYKNPFTFITREDIEEYPLFTDEDLYTRLGIFGSRKVDVVFVDGIKYNSLEEKDIRHFDVAQAEYFPGLESVLVVLTWLAVPNKSEGPIYSTTILPLGYQLPVEFYSPQYDNSQAINDPNPDLRSTIYWKPNVMVNKENKADIEFYSADAKTTYSIVIEGVGNNRELIYYKKDAFVEVK